MNKETWKPIPDFPGYDASSFGRIRSVRGRKHIMKQARQRTGYLRVSLQVPNERGGGKAFAFVHRLVCAAFHGGWPTGRMAAAHQNGKRDDNRACNLRWMTYKENEAQKEEHGTSLRGSRNGRAILTEGQAREILGLSGVESRRSLAGRYGVSMSAIDDIVKRRKWKHVVL